MRKLLFTSVLFFSVCAWGEPFLSRYESFGQLVLTNLNSAPFPHPAREKGYAYKSESFTAEKNYHDNTVAIFIPKEMTNARTADFVIHFHGWRNSVTNVLRHYELIEQLAASGRKAILVVPQGPLNAADSFGGKLEDIGGFDRFMKEVLGVIRQNKNFKDVQPRQIILSGHSGGYGVISSIVAQTNQFPVREVWLFDALYGRTEKFMKWFDANADARLLDIYTAHGGTKDETEKLMKVLGQKKISFVSGDEKSVSDEMLRTNRLVFIFTDLPHDEVVQKRKMFERFLKTSCLKSN
ncbi:MAG: hypothetical protein ABI042_10965 [Verrucomicrobiota bacterium]